MKVAALITFFVIVFLVLPVISLADKSFIVGVSPGLLSLGTLERDSTKLVNFYITTPSDESLLVELKPERGNLDFFDNTNYKNFIYNYSEEDTTSWVKVINNPVEIKPSNETIKTTGGLIKGKEQISFLVDIPKDAEPGYHVFYIEPIPSSPAETIGAVGSRVIAVISLSILFNMPGDAIRKGTILDTEAGDYSGNSLQIKTYFQNTGSVTISAKVINRIYNKTGELLEELYSGTSYLKPKEIKTFTTLLPTKNLPLGDYNVYTIADYSTNTTEKSSSIKLTAPTANVLAAKGNEEFPTLAFIAILILILIVAAIIYKRLK